MLLDTSAYSALHRGNPHIVRLLAGATKIVLPVIAVGELRYGFINGSKPKQNEETLQTFLSTDGIETVDVTITTSNYYAKLYMHTKQHGKVLSSNDLWIAALASQLRMQLVTTDGDFEAVRSLLPAGLSIVEV